MEIGTAVVVPGVVVVMDHKINRIHFLCRVIEWANAYAVVRDATKFFLFYPSLKNKPYSAQITHTLVFQTNIFWDLLLYLVG